MDSKHTVDILLVEDNPNDAELTIRELTKRKLVNNIIHLKDGQEALDWLFREGQYADREECDAPKVILLDLKMPKVNGLEVLKSVRENPKTHCIPVVMLTSSREEQDVVESYKLGVNSYIVKPVGFDNFSAAVTSAGSYWVLLNERP